MAKLVATTGEVAKEFEFDVTEEPDKYFKRTSAALEKIKKKWPIITFGVADGKAIYAVVSKKPLQLMHIPMGDAYQVPNAHIRGLRLKDVEVLIDRDKRMKAIFA